MAQQFEHNLRHMPPPEVESLCQEIRSSGESMIEAVNDAMKRLISSLTMVLSSEMRRVMRNVADECRKAIASALVEGNRKADPSSSPDATFSCDTLIHYHMDIVNRRLQQINERLYSLRSKDRVLSRLEQQLGLKSGAEERSRKVYQLLQTALRQPCSVVPASVAEAASAFSDETRVSEASRDQEERGAAAATPDQKGERKTSTGSQSATKDRTFAEILTDGESCSKKWQSRRQVGL